VARARAVDSRGQPGAWSVALPPATPTLLSPQGGVFVGARPVLQARSANGSGRELRLQSQQPDQALRADGKVQSVEWHFFVSPLTGRVGPSPTLLEALTEAGIPFHIHV
jgi:hypothetical protein